MPLPLFAATKDRKLMEQINKEMYQLYMHQMDVYKLSFRTGTQTYLYHEDIHREMLDEPSYAIEAYVDVTDNGLAALYKQGQQLDRQLFVYTSRKGLEDVLKGLNLDYHRDVPTDGDIVRIQDGLWEVMTVDPEGYHMNDRRYPFDFQFMIVPLQRSSIPNDDTRESFKRL
jgi:hypothetical protein